MEIKEKSENKHYNLTFTQEQINKGNLLKEKIIIGCNNANIFIDSMKDINGPSINIIKDELVKLFTEESIEGIQEKLKTPIDSEFMNGDFSKRGGKTRKRKRKNRKKTLKRKTKKRKGKRRKTRRKKRRSTRKRGKH